MRLSHVILSTLSCAAFLGGAEGAPLALDKVPAAVTAAAVAALPGFTATAAKSEVEDGETSYDLKGTVAGQKAKIEIEVKADGTITVEETEAVVALDNIPVATREAALKAAPGLQITKAEVETKKGKTEWTLEGTVEGKKVEVEVKADGTAKVEADEKDDDKGRKD